MNQNLNTNLLVTNSTKVSKNTQGQNLNNTRRNFNLQSGNSFNLSSLSSGDFSAQSHDQSHERDSSMDIEQNESGDWEGSVHTGHSGQTGNVGG